MKTRILFVHDIENKSRYNRNLMSIVLSVVSSETTKKSTLNENHIGKNEISENQSPGH